MASGNAGGLPVTTDVQSGRVPLVVSENFNASSTAGGDEQKAVVCCRCRLSSCVTSSAAVTC